MKTKIVSIFVLVFTTLLPFRGCLLTDAVAAMDHAFSSPAAHAMRASQDNACHKTESRSSSDDMNCCISDMLPKLQAPCMILPEPVLEAEKSWNSVYNPMADFWSSEAMWDYADWPPPNRQDYANLVGIVKSLN